MEELRIFIDSTYRLNPADCIKVGDWILWATKPRNWTRIVDGSVFVGQLVEQAVGAGGTLEFRRDKED